jgi:endo-1,4-beta-xylanase
MACVGLLIGGLLQVSGHAAAGLDQLPPGAAAIEAPPDPSCGTEQGTLREAGCQRNVLVGTMDTERIPIPELGAIVIREFSSITPGNDMKWPNLQGTQGQFTFDKADELMDFADAHGMKLKGHTLVWDQEVGNGLPDWVRQITDPAELDAVLKDHIATVVGRYAGRITRWDVVNEPLVTYGVDRYQGHFAQVLGPGYIARAFELAHAADPTAKLYLNEHSVEYFPGRADALVELVTELVDQGVPIDGVGLQMHLWTGQAPAPGTITNLVGRLRHLGLDVVISELDVPLPAGLDTDSELEAAKVEQGRVYGQVVWECVTAGCTAITVGGINDPSGWLDGVLGRPGTRAALWDEEANPKPAYFAVLAALRGVHPTEPPTTTSTPPPTAIDGPPPTTSTPQPTAIVGPPPNPASPIPARPAFTG